jgi:hypothetical protein
MKIHAIIRSDEIVDTAVNEATIAANAWMAEAVQTGMIIQHVNVQTVSHQSESDHCVSYWYIHIITIGYKEPTLRNLAELAMGII